MDLILNQYEVKYKSSSDNCLVAEILHWRKNSSCGTNSTPVGHMIMTREFGSDTFRPHYAIQLFLRSDIRYQMNNQETIVVSNHERQAGPNKALLDKLLKIRDSSSTYYHPELPDKLIEFLISTGKCDEPIGMNICHYHYSGFREKGQLWNED